MTPAEAAAKQAELTLIAQAMFATKLDAEKIELVAASDFRDERHRSIWRAITLEVREGGEDAPSLVVVDRLRQSGDLELAGGAEYVESFGQYKMDRILAGFDQAKEAVLECSRLRRIASIAKQVADAADGWGDSSQTALESLRSSLGDIEKS